MSAAVTGARLGGGGGGGDPAGASPDPFIVKTFLGGGGPASPSPDPVAESTFLAAGGGGGFGPENDSGIGNTVFAVSAVNRAVSVTN